jgi:septal ring factor EnvC (AmiA/AmiB activator)
MPPPRPNAAPSPPAPATLRPSPPPGIRAFPTVGASLTPPVLGRLATRFGEISAVGLNSKGISLATGAEAQVVAPFDGRVVFRGPFRGYGEILIIEHDGGYHSLLAGLGRTDAAVGQWLLAGEPVGIMGPASDGNPELYLELRHGGEPIDPLPWLKTRDIEANVRE